MNINKQKMIYVAIFIVIGIIIFNLPLESFSADMLKLMSASFFPAFFIGYAVLLLFQRRKKLEMRKRCTVKVPAECVSIKYKYRFLAKGRFVTAVYSYEYNGIRYTGCNNLDIRSLTRGVIEPGDKTEIYINPYRLPNELYDSIADYYVKADLQTASVLLVLSALYFVFSLFFW